MEVFLLGLRNFNKCLCLLLLLWLLLFIVFIIIGNQIQMPHKKDLRLFLQ